MTLGTTTAARRPATAAGSSRNRPGRPAPAASPQPRRRARVLLAGLAAATVLLVAAAAAISWQQLGGPAAPIQVSVGESVPVGGLDLTVEEFSRRADATMGVNTPQQPMSGPAMPMAGGTGMGGGMADMPGMAGMLQAGQERVDLSVVIGNSGGDPLTLDPTRFSLYANGQPVELLAATESSLSATALPEGSRMAGNLTFTIEQGTSPLELRYADEPARVLLESGTTPAQVPATGQHGGSTTHNGDGDGDTAP